MQLCNHDDGSILAYRYITWLPMPYLKHFEETDAENWGSKPEPPKIPSPQIQPIQERVQVDHLAVAHWN